MKTAILYLLTSLDTTGGTVAKIKSTFRYTEYKVFVGAHYSLDDKELMNNWLLEKNANLINTPTRKLSNIFQSVLLLNKVVKKENIKIVHVFFPYETYIAYFLKLLNPNLKILCSFEGNVRRSFAIRTILKMMLPRFDKIIYISNYVRDFYEELTGKCNDKIIIDNPGYHLCEYESRKKGLKCNIVSVAGINPMKNVFMYAEIGRVLKERNFPFVLKVVGDGPLYKDLEEKIIEYKIDDCVKLKGKQVDPKPYYREADIYIHPADKEGFGIVIPEAMSSGLPVIVSNKGGLPELVSNMEDGIVVDAYKAEEWAEAVIKLYSNRALYDKISQKGYDTYKKRFTPERYAYNLDLLYEDLLK